MKLLSALAILGVLQTSEPVVRPGVDVLQDEPLPSLAGRRIGLITNHTGRTLDGTSTLAVLRDELGLEVAAIFSPEHGFRGDVAAGDEIGSDFSQVVPVYSLYGDTRAPTAEMLSGLDVLVFDIQDIGVRFYTYISTMKLAMDGAAREGLGFVVLDRPNPNGGVRVEGPVLDVDFASFVGIESIPLVHGMTAGELARLFRPETLELEVVPMSGWNRTMMWRDTGLPWNAPSPNIRTARAALAYPALGLIEGVNVSEGRGIDETFERMGAPWIDGNRLAAALTRRDLPGVVFAPTSFTPRVTPAAPRPKYENELCFGISMTITEPQRFEAVRTGLEVVATVRTLFPDSFEWVRRGERYWIDLLLGTDRVRRSLDADVEVGEILRVEKTELDRFIARRSAHLLY